MYGKADVVVCDLWVQYGRDTRIQFSYPVLQTCATFIVPRPHRKPHTWYSVFAGLSNENWLALSIVLFIYWGLLWICKKLSQKKAKFLTLDKILIDLLTLIITPNSVKSPDINAYSQILTAWTLFSNFIVLFYSCNIISSLTVPHYMERIDSLEDCIANNLTLLTTFPIDPNVFFDMTKPSHVRFNENYKLSSDTNLYNSLIEKELFAILIIYYFDGTATIDAGHLVPYMKYHPSKFRLMRNCLYSPYTSFGFPLNSPFYASINWLLLYMFESGIFLYHKRQEITKHHPIDWESIFLEDQTTADVQVLRVEHIFGAFVIFACGHILALLVFLVEIKEKISFYLKYSANANKT